MLNNSSPAVIFNRTSIDSNGKEYTKKEYCEENDEKLLLQVVQMVELYIKYSEPAINFMKLVGQFFNWEYPYVIFICIFIFFVIDLLLNYITSMTCIILLLINILILSRNSFYSGNFTKIQNIGEDYKIAVEHLHARLSFYSELYNILTKAINYTKGIKGIAMLIVLLTFAIISLFVKSVWVLTSLLLLTGVYKLLMQNKTVQDFVIALDYS